MEDILEEFCRICFKTPEKTLLDFEPYRDLVEKVTQAQPISDPSLIPNKICESCASSLLAAGIFRVKCLEANARCQKLLAVEYIEEELKPVLSPPPPSQKKKRIRLCCDHCGELYDAGTVSELRAMIEETLDFQLSCLAPPSSRICETCLARYMITTTLAERIRSLKFESYPAVDCCVCGRRSEKANLETVDWKIRYLAAKLVPDASIDFDSWLWICGNCASDFTVTMELFSEREAEMEVLMEDNTVPFEIIFRAELEDDFLIEPGMPLETRLQGDDFEWPLEKEADPILTPIRNQEPRISCPECGRVMFGATEAELHKEIGHGKNCKFCGVEIPRYSRLREHVLGHLPHFWPWLCDFCGSRFKIKKHFEIHYNIHDPNRYCHICDFCKMAHPSKPRLKQHIERRHLGIKNFKCTYCPKQYGDLTDLKRHLCRHTGQYPYRCEACAKGFSRKRFYTQHLETHE